MPSTCAWAAFAWHRHSCLCDFAYVDTQARMPVLRIAACAGFGLCGAYAKKKRTRAGGNAYATCHLLDRISFLMRIAVLGLGFMGSTHLKALKNIPQARLTAVVSGDEKKLA